jgi:hypothetical protein
MKWKDIQSSKTAGDYFKFEDGINQVRVVSEPEMQEQHFIESENKGYVCPGRQNGCKYCAQGMKSKVRFLTYIIDRKDKAEFATGKVKLAFLPWSVVSSIREYQEDPEYAFNDTPNYDFRIKKEGQKLNTKYTVIPGQMRSELTPDEKAQVESMKPIAEVIKGLADEDHNPTPHVQEVSIGQETREIRIEDIPF